MGHLAAITEHGLEASLTQAIAGAAPADATVAAAVRGLVDRAGLKGPEVLKGVATLQKQKKLKKETLYPAFLQLSKQLEEAIAGNGKSKSKKEEVVEAEAAVDISTFNFTEDQEAKIKARMEREEARMRERLLKREAKIREHVATGKPLRVGGVGRTPSGVPAEKLERWRELSAQIREAKEKRKELSQLMKTAKEEQEKIRPKRERAKRTKKAAE